MLWNTIPDEERLRLWKSLRAEIQDMDLQSRLKKVAEFCSKIPHGARTIDYYTPASWPTPWEILFHGSFCASSVSLLAYYSLNVVDTTTKIDMLLVEGPSAGIFLLPVVEDQYVLNYLHGAVNNISDVKDEFIVLEKYTQDEIRNIT